MDENDLQVRWKQHQLGVMSYLRQLLVSETFVDVTLCCQNKRFKAHRVLLSACSSYLQQVLVEHLTSDHVTIILPDIHPEDMQWLLDFMYTGSVAIPRNRLTSFLQAAESLHIKVLADLALQQKISDYDRVICISACLPYSKDNKEILSVSKSPNIKSDNSTDDVKVIPNEKCGRLSNNSPSITNKAELKNGPEDRMSCMFKCSLDRLPCMPGSVNSTDPKSVCALNEFSLYENMSKRAQVTDCAEQKEREHFPGTRQCNSTSSPQNTTEMCGRPSESSPEKGFPNNKPTSNGIDSNCNQNQSSALNNHSNRLMPLPQTERECSNDRIGNSEDLQSPSEYGLLQTPPNDLHIIAKENGNKYTLPVNGNQEYGQDLRVNGDMPSRNQYRNFQPENMNHYSEHLHRLAQWPKPIPSLMPISNNYHYNGQFPENYFSKDIRVNGAVSHLQQFKEARQAERKDILPDPLQNIKDIIPNITSTYQNCSSISPSEHLMKDIRCSRGVWTPKPIHANGQRSNLECRMSMKRISQKVPRLSPIVPPSPWAQNHRPPCAAPISCPSRVGTTGFSYQSGSWSTSPIQQAMVGAMIQQSSPLPSPSAHLPQMLSDLPRSSPATPAPNMMHVGNSTRSPSPSSIPQNRSENVSKEPQSNAQKRTSENLDVFCRLKERRLQEFYKDQMSIKFKSGINENHDKEDEASDLSTKSSHSPRSNRSSPTDYSPSLIPTLQQKMKTLAELTSAKLPSREEVCPYKENIKVEDVSPFRNGDPDVNNVEVKIEQTDEIKSQSAETKYPGSEQNGNGRIYGQEDEDIQILKEAKRPILTKNDSNNNNGIVDDTAPVTKNHGCEDCGKCFSRRQLLVQHRRIHTGERPYSCADCGRQFTQRGHWSTHQKLHEPARRPEHACPSCGKAFVTRASLKVHLRTHTGEKPFQCGECGKQFSQLRNYKYHRSVHEGTREFAATCPECGKYFNDRGYLSSHMKIHRNRKEYGCQYCGKSFNQRVAYNMHVRIHTGERPHSCPHCNKSFSRKMLLKQHLRIHTGEKPFACSVCGKAFADRSNMTLHMRLHSGIKPYSCQLCSKAFTKKHHLKTHLNYHTGTKPYSCSKCGLRFSQSSNMRTHYKKCTSAGPVVNVDTPVNLTETTKLPVTEANGSTSPSSSPGRSDVTVTSAAVITPPHSDESSCGSSVIPRNSIEAQPA